MAMKQAREVDVAQFVEALSTFFEDQKLRTQDRIRKCETFMNNPLLQSKSVKEGLVCLLNSAEDDYSTLLHLERVLNMKNSGDFIPRAAASKVPDFGARPYGDRTAKEFQAASAAADGFVEGVKGSGHGAAAAAGDDIYDLELEAFSGQAQRTRDGGESPPPPEVDARRRKNAKKSHCPQTQPEEADDYPDEASPVRTQGCVAIRTRQRGTVPSMGQSLPVSIPLPEKGAGPAAWPILRSIGDDGDDEIPADNIPTKIAEIAKSLYDRSMHGEFPTSPQFAQDV